MPKKEQEPTNQEILVTVQEVLGAVNNFATYVERRFEGIDRRFDSVDKRFEAIDRRFEAIDQRFDGVDQRFDRIEANMVTKDYLDDKLADLRSDFGILIRKEDKKVNSFIKVVNRKKVISNQEAAGLLVTGPFPR